MVSSKTDDHALHLQPETDIEIFRHVCIRPPFCLAVRRVDEGDALKGFPAEKCIVADERRYIACANAVLNCCVDDVGEVRDWLGISLRLSVGGIPNTYFRFQTCCARLA